MARSCAPGDLSPGAWHDTAPQKISKIKEIRNIFDFLRFVVTTLDSLSEPGRRQLATAPPPASDTPSPPAVHY
ncbi:MAG: hypothetical protein VX254_05600 [Planctomycetota bacterium]|nr:hypothetical protein [Planctomycetota bacterium]